MKSSILVNGSQYISASRAAEITKYSRDYIGQLCRSGKIPSTMFLRSWFVDLNALTNYRDETEKNLRLYNQNGGAAAHTSITSPDDFKAVVFSDSKASVVAEKPKAVRSSYVYSEDARPLLPTLKDKAPRNEVSKPLSTQVAREFNSSKPHSAAFVALFMFIGASMAAAAYPNETWRLASAASESIGETFVGVGDEIAKVSESVSSSLFTNTVSRSASAQTVSNDASVGSWLSSAGHSVVLAIRRLLGIDDAPVNTNIFATDSQTSATSSVVYVYRQFPTKSGSITQSTTQQQSSTVVYVPSSTGVSTSRVISLENNVSYLTDQIGMLQNSQLDLRDFITQTVGQSISNAFRGVNFGGGTTVVNSGGGGSGTVTSVDVSGGTTGLAATGGPVTTSGTLTLSGILNIANGGTGTSTAPTYGKLLLGNSSGGYDLVATSSIGLGGSSGTVSSVNASGGTTGLSFSGGAITTSGTLTLGGTLILANGGTGLNSAGASSTLLQSNGTSLVYQKLSPGLFTTANISQWTNDAGYLTSASVPGYPFTLTGNATSTLTQFNGGLTAYASSTIGNGTQIGGLTINGGATTTGNAYIAGSLNVTGPITSPNQISAGSYYSNQGGSNGYFYNSVSNGGLITGLSPGTYSTELFAGAGGNVLINTDAGNVVTVTSQGGFGIGTTSPYRQLSVGNSGVFGGNVLAASFTSTSTATSTFAGGIDAARICITGTTKCLDTITNGTSSAYPFALTGNATSTLTQFNGGLTAYASSTIGNGTQIGGLTINGGATTTGNATIVGNLTANVGNTSLQGASFGVSGTQFSNNVNFGLNNATAIATLLANNVGIGTTSPSKNLSVQGNGLISGDLSVANVNATGTIVINSTSNYPLSVVDSSAGSTVFSVAVSGNVGMYVSGGFPSQNVLDITRANGTGSYLQISSPSGSGGDLFRVTGAGFVGIGTTSPYRQLSVGNSAVFGGNVTAANFTSTSTIASVFPYASTTALTIAGALYGANLTNCTAGNKLLWADGTFSCAIDQTGGGTGGGTWSTTTSSVTGQYVNYSNNSTDIVAIGNNSTTSAKFFFDPNVQVGYISGRLGIGTTSPSLPLSVQGNAIFSGNLSLAGLTATGTVKFAGITGSTQCLHVDTNGLLSGTGSDCGAGGASFGQGWDIGSKGYVGALSPTTTIGIGVSASSTIGNGLQAGGLTINGGATTTGSSYFMGNVGIGSSTPLARLQVSGNNADNLLDLKGNSDSKFTVNGTGGTMINIVPGSGSSFYVTYNGGSTQQLNVGQINTSWDYYSLSGGTYQLLSGPNTNQFDVWATKTGSPLTLGTNNTERLRISASGLVGIGTTSPYAALSVVGASGIVADKYTATSTTATSTFAGGLDVGNGGFSYDFTSGITSIASAVMGSLSFDTDAGLVSWTDLPVSSAIAGTPEGYIAYLAGNPAITVYGTSTGSGNVSGPFVGIGTSTPSAFALSVQGSSLISGNLNLANLVATGTLTVSGAGTSTFTGRIAATSASTTATSTMAGINLPYGGCVAVGGVCLTTNTGNINPGVLGQLAFYGADGTTVTGSSTASLTMSRYIATGTIASSFLYASTTAFTTSGSSYFATLGGNVGIGTTSPYAKLSISNNVGDAVNTPLFAVASTSAGLSTSTLFTVLANGKVGINTSSPSTNYRLDVQGATLINGAFDTLSHITLLNNSAVYFLRNGNSAISSNADGVIQFSNSSLGSNATLVSGKAVFGSSTPLGILSVAATSSLSNIPLFSIQTPTTAGLATSTAFIVDANGNTGIGTSSPYRQLSVGNSAVFGGNVTAATFTATSTVASVFPYASTTMITATTASTTNLVLSGLTGSTQCLRVSTLGVVSGTGSDCNSAGTLSPWATTTSTVAGQLIAAPLNATDIVTVGTNSTTTSKFFFDPNQQIGYISGKLGIGTTTPAEKIDVMGNVNISTGSSYKYNNVSVVSAITGLSDYFFGAAGNLGMAGSNNIGVGLNALRLNTSGGKNIALGTNAMNVNDSGSSNLALGYQSLLNNDSGSGNLALGEDALKLNVSGANNTVLGYTAGNTLTGSNNLLLGALVGQNLTTGSNNIAIGYNINTPAAGSANTLNIGNMIYGTGIDGTGSTLSSGKIGIGTTTPFSTFSINTTAGASPFSVGSSTGSYLHINSFGNIGAGTSNPNNKLTVQTGSTAGKVEIGNLSDATSYGGIGFGTIGSLAQNAYSIAGNGSSLILNSTAGTLFNINNAGAAVLTSGGNFGVGTSSPYRQLSIGNSAVFGDNVLAASFNATSTTATSSIAGTFSVGSTTPEGTALFAVGTSTSRFSINKNTGFVGAGTTNPTEKLSVGSGAENNDISVSSVTGDKLFFSAFNDLGVLSVNRRPSDGAFANGALAAPMIILSSASSNSSIGFYTTPTNNALPLERFSITNLGAVGIGTSTPSSQFSLQGSALFSGNLSLANLTATGTLTVSGTASSTFAGGIDAARVCLTGTTTCLGASGVVSSGVAGQLAFYGASGTTVTGSSTASLTMGRYIATSTTASNFLYASTTALTSSGSAYLATAGGSVGIGTTTPFATLSVNTVSGVAPLSVGSSTASYLTVDQTGMTVVGGAVPLFLGTSPSRFSVYGGTTANLFQGLAPDGGQGRFSIMTNGDSGFMSPVFRGDRGRNTVASPSAVQNGDTLFDMTGCGWNTSTYQCAANIDIVAAETYSGSTNASYIKFSTAASGNTSVLERVRVDSTGNLGVGTTSPYRQLSVGNSGVFGGNVLAANFTATSTIASIFPYASSTFITSTNGLLATASSTIGNGTQIGGLTVSGGATTTGNMLVVGSGAILGGAYVDQGLYVNCASAATDCVSTNGVLASGNVRLSQNYGGLTYFGTSGASLTFPAVNAITLSTGPGSGYLNFNTNGGGDVARIVDNGNFGIGTTTPQRKLWVTNNGSNAQIALEDTGATANNHYGSLSYSRGRFSFNVMNDALASTTRLTIDSNGNVGIGTSTPYAALSVVGATGVVADKYTATSTATSTFAGGIDAARICLTGTTTCLAPGGGGGSGTVGSGVTGQLAFYNSSGTSVQGSSTASLTMGRYIATSTIASNFLYASTSVLTLTGTGGEVLSAAAGNLSVNGSSGNITIGGNAILASNGLFNGSVSNAGYSFNSGTDALNLRTSAIGTAMTIVSSGNVGIGTTTPQRKLWVTNDGSNAQIALEDTGATANNHYGSLSYSRGRFSFNVMTDALASSTRLTIDSNGNVGIGTTTPYAALSVVGASGVVADKFYATSTTATSTFAGGLNVGNGGLAYDFTTGITSIASARMGNLSFDTDAGLVTWTDLPVSSATAGTPEGYTAFLAGNPAITVYGTSTGAGAVTSTMVGIATTTPWRSLSVNGTVSMVGLTTMAGANGNAICLSALNEVVVNSGAQTCTLSSGRFKHDIASSTSGLDTVMALNPVTFYYNADAKNKDQQFGFIAEDVQKVDPRLVALDGEGKPQTVRYEEFTAVLAKAIQEQQIELVALKTNASSTATTLDTLSSAIDSIGSGSSGSQTVVVQPDTSSTTLALSAAVQVLQGQVIKLQIDSASTSAAIAAINTASTSEEIAQTVSVNLASSTSFIQVIASSVQSLIQSAGEWVVAKITATLAVFNRVETQTAAVTKGLEMTDQATGQIYCVVIKNGDFAKIPGTCESMATSTPAVATTTAPIIAPTVPVVPIVNNTPNSVTIVTSTSTTQTASSTSSEQNSTASSSPVVTPTATTTTTTTTPAVSTSTDPVVTPSIPADATTTTSTPNPESSPATPPATTTPEPAPTPVVIPVATETTTTTP